MFVTVDDVKKFHGLKPTQLGYEKGNEAELNKVLVEWILQCQDLIKQYTNNKFTKEIPDSVKNVCLRLVSNMITVAVQRRDSPIIKVNDWTITTGSSEIFTEDLKKDLKPFIIEKSVTADPVGIMAITGEDL